MVGVWWWETGRSELLLFKFVGMLVCSNSSEFHYNQAFCQWIEIAFILELNWKKQWKAAVIVTVPVLSIQ